MIKLDASQFGNSLLWRQDGREAVLSTLANLLRNKPKDEMLEIDFTKIFVLAPSWAGEFFAVLKEQWGDGIKITPTDNPSVELTLKTIGMS